MAATTFKLTFYGGVGAVTGSNFLLEGAGKRILIDCGLIQGHFRVGDKDNRASFPYDPVSIDLVFITHSHIDHVGRLPKLVREGFRGTVYSTPPTKEISAVMLEDSMGVLTKEAMKDNLPPLYSEENIQQSLRLWKTTPYHEAIDLGNGLTARFLNSGHVLGSAMVEFTYNNKKIVLTGDLGNSPSLLLKDCEAIHDVDYLVMESVYGDRNHESKEERKRMLEAAVEEAIEKGGVLMIPAFSLERTQEILYEMKDLLGNKKVPEVPIYLDSPLAIKVTAIYDKYCEDFNDRVGKVCGTVDEFFSFPELKKTFTTDESKAIKSTPSPKVIIAGSGMSNGGRIVHHEKHYLPGKQNILLLIGYQAAGTAGRILQEGAKSITMFGENIPIEAKVMTISGYSAHKDSDALMEFAAGTKDNVKKLFAVMGEPKSALYFVQKLRDYVGINAVAPSPGETALLDMS